MPQTIKRPFCKTRLEDDIGLPIQRTQCSTGSDGKVLGGNKSLQVRFCFYINERRRARRRFENFPGNEKILVGWQRRALVARVVEVGGEGIHGSTQKFRVAG